MTTARIIGTSYSSPIDQAKNKYTENRDGSGSYERVFRALEIDWVSKCPPRGSTYPGNSNAILVNRSAAASSIPGLVDVTLIYEIPKEENLAGGGMVSQSLPPDEYTETANSIEAPIEAHPGFSQSYNGMAAFGTVQNGAIFNADGKFTGWKKESPFCGFLTYKVASVTETVTQYFWSKPASVSTLIGHRQSGNWLVITGSITRRYPYWARSISRIWSQTPWPAEIYGN